MQVKTVNAATDSTAPVRSRRPDCGARDAGTSPLPMPADMAPDQFPRIVPFRRLINMVAGCISTEPTDDRTFLTALLIWQQLHGIVSLRISRPRFPWPPLAETVIEAVDRILAGAQPA